MSTRSKEGDPCWICQSALRQVFGALICPKCDCLQWWPNVKRAFGGGS